MIMGIKQVDLLSILDQNGRIPYARLGKQLGITRQRALYNISRMQQLGIYRGVIGVLNVSKCGFSYYRLHLKLQFSTEDVEKSILSDLAENKQVVWLVRSDGRFDILVGFIAHSVYEFNEFINHIIRKHGKYMRSYEYAQILEAPFISRIFKSASARAQKKGHWIGRFDSVLLDPIDKIILNGMCRDFRTSTMALAKLCKISPVTVAARVKKLIDQQVVMSYALVSYEKLGLQLYKTLLYFHNTNPKRQEELVKYLHFKEITVDVIKCLGQWQMELDIEVENIEKYRDFIYEIKKEFIDLIRDHETLYISKEIKFSFSVF